MWDFFVGGGDWWYYVGECVVVGGVGGWYGGCY